jgi:predicted MFS family arabinose efflux permease
VNPVQRALGALGVGVRSRDFWLLAGSFFVCGASTNGLIGTHLIAACIDNGIPEVTGAGLLAAMGLFDMVGTTLSGWLSDRWDNRMLLAWYYGLRGLSLLALPFAFNADIAGFGYAGLGLFAIFYGLDWIATIPPTVRLAARCFGENNAPVMFAWIGAAHQAGGASAAWLAGVVRTDAGSYTAAFMAAGAMCLVASVLVAFIGRGVEEKQPAVA